MTTLDDLRRIIRRIETTRPPRPAPEPVEKLLGGEIVETPEGRLVCVRHEYPLTHRHGGAVLEAAFAMPSELFPLIAPSAPSPGADLERLLFLDTETTGLQGGTGTYAFLVGVGALDGDRFVVTQYFMRDFDDEPALLALLAPVVERASAIVTYNGAAFDVPLLETRFVLTRRRWPSTLAHLDLLRPSRRVWSAHLADCRLATLEREVLGLVRDTDVASALIPALYFDFIRYRRAAPLPAILRHNRDDVLSLVALLGWFATALGGDGPGLSPEERAGLGRLWERVDADRAAQCYRDALGVGLTGVIAHRVRLRLARWEKRAARWDAACVLWDEATQAGVFDPLPWEELAKFYEHRRRDVGTAHAIAARALELARTAAAPPHVVDAFTHRLGRLERRLTITR